MLTQQQRERLAILQQGEQNNTLTPTEQAEFDGLLREVEAKEAAYLHPATQRIRQERLAIEAQNAAMRNLIQRQERLTRRLERVLALSKAEREAIKTELAHILESASSRAGAGR